MHQPDTFFRFDYCHFVVVLRNGPLKIVVHHLRPEGSTNLPIPIESHDIETMPILDLVVVNDETVPEQLVVVRKISLFQNWFLR